MSNIITQTLSDVISVRPRFGRSVHLERDLATQATTPENYFLTPSALEALNGVLRAQHTPADRALSLIGPYGAGKSAFATFLARLVSDPQFKLNVKLPDNLPDVPKLLPVPLVGSRAAIGPALLAALRLALETAPGSPTLPPALLSAEMKPNPRALANAYLASGQAVAAAGVHEGLLLLVDEAGKFLEHAAGHSQAGDVFVLQELAEAASRAPEGTQLWVLIILHQNVEAYAYRLGRTQQAEWSKVAQRFRQLPLFPSDVERMDLIGRALYHDPNLHLNGTFSAQLEPVINHQSQFLPVGFANRFEQLARAAYPLHPVTLLAVPALFRRAGQSHRSIFNFLEGQENGALGQFLNEQIYDPANPAFFPLDTLFDYGRDVLLTHYTGPTARTWLEAVELVSQAINKEPALSFLAVKVLKCIALLNWLREPRLSASRTVLAAALGPGVDAVEALTELERRSLIVYSRARNSYRLWEVGDVDIDAELNAARASLSGDVLLLATSDQTLFQLPRLIARRHSFRTGTLRPVGVEVVRPADLINRTNQLSSDLTVILCLAPNQQAQDLAEKDAQRLNQPNLLVGVALETEGLREAAYYLAASRVVADTITALAGDRAGRRELALRRYEAEMLFRSEWGRLYGPALGGDSSMAEPTETPTMAATWFWNGEVKAFANAGAFSRQLSQLADSTFPNTAILRNEILNRRQLSSAGAAARSLLVKAMLSQGHQERLGFTGFPPEFAMYASMLLATGIHYRTENGVWAWRSPKQADESDPFNLVPAWKAIEDQVFNATEPLPLPSLYSHLRAAPHGLTDGVLPVLVAAFRRVREGDTSLYREGQFLAEEKEADWELLLRRPDMFALADSRVAGARLAVVERIANATGVKPQLVPVVRRLLRMQASLPEFTQQTRHLPAAALALREAFQKASAPEFLLFQSAPAALGLPSWLADAPAEQKQVEDFFTQLNQALQAWAAAYPTARDQARDYLLQACGLPGGEDSWLDLHQRVQALPARTLPPFLSPFVNRFTDVQNPSADLERVLALVANRPPNLWRDSDVTNFPSYAAPFGAALQAVWNGTTPAMAPARPSVTALERKQVKQLLVQFDQIAKPANGQRPPTHVVRAAVLEWLDSLEENQA
ncbi:hypothetical protein [Adhaeribacter rhizoryzae]|uniref:ATP-binding protein n=1 Tax=Adhaeribacter rhizoryzae TaxID=2607907 RepID=A0A5M6DQ47_9BACT|nr:hypothetical protein [Adhaeribacter rhizoryzae]KAA5548349.1 hypothetical protein F0145_06385 [Adhaeribacter rhizoryzae]